MNGCSSVKGSAQIFCGKSIAHVLRLLVDLLYRVGVDREIVQEKRRRVGENFDSCQYEI
jgi:hypothetical protein